MLYFKAKMHQIPFRLGLRPQIPLGSLQRSPRPWGRTSKGKEVRGRGMKEGKEGKERA